MTAWIWIAILLLTGIIVLYKKGRKEAAKEPPIGATILYKEAEEAMFMEIDEHSPENLIFEKALKAARLRKKLQNIEKEREKK
jgi:hypothetical protein